MTGDELRDFSEGVLRGIGAPASAWNLEFMSEWARSEGTLADHNPFASTRPAEGATIFNSAKVRNYIDDDQGIAATVATLGLSYYRAIVHGLQNQTLADREAIVKGLETWSGTTTPKAYHIAHLVNSGWQPRGARTVQSEEITQPARTTPAKDASQAVTEGAVTPKQAKGGESIVADTVKGAAPVGVLLALMAAVEATNWTPFEMAIEAHHWPMAAGLFVATPLASAIVRAVRRWIVLPH